MGKQIQTQSDPPQGSTQPPPNLEIRLENKKKQKNGAAQQTPEDKKIAEVENLIKQKWEISKERAMRDRKPVPKKKNPETDQHSSNQHQTRATSQHQQDQQSNICNSLGHH